MRNPPALAVWLLRRFGSGDGIDTLLGDLTEEYREGRSERWFWSQSASAVVVTALHSLRSGPLPIIGAAAAGIVLSLALQYALALLVNWLTLMSALAYPPALRVHFAMALFVGPTLACLTGLLAGRVVAGLARNRRVSAVALVGLAMGVMSVTGVPFDAGNAAASALFERATDGLSPTSFPVGIARPGAWAGWHLLGLLLGSTILGEARRAGGVRARSTAR